MSACRISAASKRGAHLLRLEGDVRLTLCTALDEYCDRTFSDPQFASLAVDVTEATGIDSTVLGMLAKIAIKARELFDFKPVLYSCNPGIDRLLSVMGFAQLFELRTDYCGDTDSTADVPMASATEEEVRSRVIEAHRTLMALNDANKEAFEDLVKVLEEN